MDRLYLHLIPEHFEIGQQMLFFSGPRQVGKTTICEEASQYTAELFCFNWDVTSHKLLITKGPEAVGLAIDAEKARDEAPIVIFDEIHKYKDWKNFIKGFYDLYKKLFRIIVTGSAKLDVYKKGGDSLTGRYFPCRIHPLSVAECLRQTPTDTEIHPPSPIADDLFTRLWEFGGFPDPFLKANTRFHTKWQKLKTAQLIREEIRDMTKIQELSQIEILTELLKHQAINLVNFSDLSVKIGVSSHTIKRWITTLEKFYYCFLLKPWTKNVVRSLLKEPKIYLWDWSDLQDPGARAENFVASHLLKAVHWWNDRGFGEYGLYFIRNKEKKEVDFLVTKNKKPWFLVEVKLNHNKGVSRYLYEYQESLSVPHAFQVVIDAKYQDVNCFSFSKPVIVSAKTFLSQLV